MNPIIGRLEEIDVEIAAAYIALGAARTACAACPTAENARAVDTAGAEVDRLLDDRLATLPGQYA